MKLFNPALAGMKLGTKKGPIEVGKDGSVEVADEDIANALLNSGFRAEEPKGKPQAKPQPRQSAPVVETPKAPEPEPEQVVVEDPKPEEFEDDDEDEEEDEEDEVEVEDLADYTAKDAMDMVLKEDDIDVLEAWKTSESEGKNRKTVLKTLSERISEVS